MHLSTMKTDGGAQKSPWGDLGGGGGLEWEKEKEPKVLAPAAGYL